MSLPLSVVNYFDARVVRAYKAPLQATNMIAKGDPLPPGTGYITRDQIANFTGTAKRGYRVRTIPRETGERTPKTVTVQEHTYGFELHRKALQAYERQGETALNGEDASQSGRLVAESLDDVIWNGDANASIKGIYSDAGLTPFELEEGAEWDNTATPTGPDVTIVEAMSQLEDTQLYIGMAKKMALNPKPYWQLFNRVPNTSNTYMDYIEQFFPNGRNDIYISAQLGTGVGSGLLCYFDPLVAERNIEEDINTRVVNGGVPDKEDMIYFNVETYQALDIHHDDAFLPLENLVEDADSS